MVVFLIAVEDFWDSCCSVAAAAAVGSFPSRRGETRRGVFLPTELLSDDDADDDDEGGDGGDGVVATEDAMHAMSAADTAVRDTAFVALLGRLRPFPPPGCLFLADALVFAPRGGMTKISRVSSM